MTFIGVGGGVPITLVGATITDMFDVEGAGLPVAFYSFLGEISIL